MTILEGTFLFLKVKGIKSQDFMRILLCDSIGCLKVGNTMPAVPRRRKGDPYDKLSKLDLSLGKILFHIH